MAPKAPKHQRTRSLSLFRACFSAPESPPPRNQSLRKQLSRTYEKYISKKQDIEEDPSIPETDDDYPIWNDNELTFYQGSKDIRDSRQSFILCKGEDYLIHPSVESIQMGLGWDKGVAVDASTVIFDSTLTAVDTVWCKKLCSTCGSVTHSGSNLPGAGEGDNEVITVELSDVPFRIHHILFVVCIFSEHVSFRQIKSATVRMIHSRELENHELGRFAMTEGSGHAIVMGVLTRKGPYWNFRSLGIPAAGRSIMEVLRNPRNLDCLGTCQSWAPEMRYITVQVVRGTGLAAKDELGFFKKRPSSDPYFIISFKNKRYASEYKLQTLEPEWNSAPFQIGWITELESQWLRVQVFNYDAVEANDFMGFIQVSARSLFDLGPGNHHFWFELQRSKERAHKHEEVSGKILLNFRVDGSATHLQDM